MHFFVPTQKTTLGERGSALIAHKWTLACVHSFVQFLGVFHLESFRTVGAGEREGFSLVDEHMLLEVLPGLVGFAANVANELDVFWRVSDAAMFAERIVGLEHFVAQIARIEAGLVVHLAHMEFVFFAEKK